MWSQSPPAYTVWTWCGKPAPPPTPRQSTAVIAPWRWSWASLCRCCGASSSPTCRSSTSGLPRPACGASRWCTCVWVDPIRWSYTPTWTRSSRRWGRSTVAWEWFCARRCERCAAWRPVYGRFTGLLGDPVNIMVQANKRCGMKSSRFGSCFYTVSWLLVSVPGFNYSDVVLHNDTANSENRDCHSLCSTLMSAKV